jgi:hypothetical protein
LASHQESSRRLKQALPGLPRPEGCSSAGPDEHYFYVQRVGPLNAAELCSPSGLKKRLMEPMMALLDWYSAHEQAFLNAVQG